MNYVAQMLLTSVRPLWRQSDDPSFVRKADAAQKRIDQCRIIIAKNGGSIVAKKMADELKLKEARWVLKMLESKGYVIAKKGNNKIIYHWNEPNH